MLTTETPDGSTSPTRPICKCGKIGPTIGGRCPEHMTVHDEGHLMTVSAEDVLMLARRNAGL